MLKKPIEMRPWLPELAIVSACDMTGTVQYNNPADRNVLKSIRLNWFFKKGQRDSGMGVSLYTYVQSTQRKCASTQGRTDWRGSVNSRKGVEGAGGREPGEGSMRSSPHPPARSGGRGRDNEGEWRAGLPGACK